MKKLKILCLFYMAFCMNNLFAQQVERIKPDEQTQQAMSVFLPFIGIWEGQASMYRGNQTFKVKQTEIAAFKANGSALVLEGIGYNDKNQVIFEALGVIVFNKQDKKYYVRAVRGDGFYTDTEVLVNDGTLQWFIPGPNGGTARNTVKFTENTWKETGEYSRDGNTWAKYFEMTLTKKE